MRGATGNIKEEKHRKKSSNTRRQPSWLTHKQEEENSRGSTNTVTDEHQYTLKYTYYRNLAPTLLYSLEIAWRETSTTIKLAQSVG